MIDRLTATDFAALIGTDLAVRANFGDDVVAVPLTLVAIDERAGLPGERAPFALQLDGPAVPVLAQGTYPIEHPAHGPLELFVVPHAAGPDGTQYSISFG